MSGVVTKDQVIYHAQHLDLIFSQSGMLYNLIRYGPLTSDTLIAQQSGPFIDSLISAAFGTIVTQLSRKYS